VSIKICFVKFLVGFNYIVLLACLCFVDQFFILKEWFMLKQISSTR
jgi:hypothetical protein